MFKMDVASSFLTNTQRLSNNFHHAMALAPEVRILAHILAGFAYGERMTNGIKARFVSLLG